MTRFARAKGSKASNERLPESATSWSQMKAELLNKNDELAEKKERENALKKRQENYQKFLDEKEEEEDKKIAWAEFPTQNGFEAAKKRRLANNLNNSGSEGKKTSLNNQNALNKKAKLDDMALAEPDSDGESDGEFSTLKLKLDKILDQKEVENNDSDDEPPEEASIKEKPKEIIVKKPKVIKKKLKIVVDKEQQASSETNNNSPVANGNKSNKKAENFQTLSEKSKRLVEKKLQRKNKQNEKKILKKQKQAEQNPSNPTGEPLSKTPKSSSIGPSDEALLAKKQKKLERRKKQKEKVKMLKQASKEPQEPKVEVLTEKDKLKIEKKKERRARQADKRKKFREAKAQAEAQAEQNGVPSQENKDESVICKREEPNKVATNKEAQGEPNQPQNNQNKPSIQKKPLQKLQNQKKPKPRDNKEHQRRKDQPEKMMINGKEIGIGYIEGFPVKKDDADRLKQLRKEMISKGLPRSEINASLKLERRRAEKALAREKKYVCFNCRKSGHNLSECPELDKDQVAQSGTGICFKCGSTEHTHFECKVVKGLDYKFASCFICQEQGHIAKQCPDNQRGLYPKGGSCKVCGDVTHLKKDCPKYQAQQSQLQNSLSIGTMDSGNPDDLDNKPLNNSFGGDARRFNKVIKF